MECNAQLNLLSKPCHNCNWNH